jgi:aminopeptidase N
MKHLRFLFSFFLFLYSSTYVFSQNNRSDSIDIIHTYINLDLTDYSNQYIKGECGIVFTPKTTQIQAIAFDLLKLQVDSVVWKNQALAFSYNDTLLLVNFNQAVSNSDTDTVYIYYQGTPQKDASGWGGFYFQSGYIFNLGVGFDANPHNYGRVWYPCFDNFVEHSTYSFNIKTAGGRKAKCNGYLVAENIISGDTIESIWQMDTPIPSYLVCVAAANYETVHQQYINPTDTIPIELYALANDTVNLKNSFIHLKDAIAGFENYYYPYIWNKVGYSLVPFSSGAMEHATNIAYPKTAANGSITYETLMAHELSHHWWGDLVTCETAEDMWINEGMATYSEHLFLNYLYGYDRYLDEVKKNHADVLQFAHVHENGYRAISGIPHQYTYGEHVYNKGASVVHNLRGYMGDSLFFSGLRQILNAFKHQNINSYQFRDSLTAFTGFDASDFFNDWVFSPGFSHFELDSASIVQNGSNFNATLFIEQKLKGTVNFHQNVPLEISFYDQNWNKTVKRVIVSGQFSTPTVLLNFNPQLIIINQTNKLNQARTDDEKIIKSTGNTTFSLSKFTLTVNAVSDSALVFIQHHLVAPDSIKNNINNYRISSRRYWSVKALTKGTFDASARIFYDGRASTGYLDSDLVSVTEDSLLLLYRASPADDWQEYPYYTKNVIGNNANAYGLIEITSLVPGDYAFANGISNYLSIKKNNLKEKAKLFPNPASEKVNIILPDKSGNYQLKVYNNNGQLILTKEFMHSTTIDTTSWTKGMYLLNISKIMDGKALLTNSQTLIKN